MSWVRIDDGFANHPKVEPLTDKAFRLFVCGLCFAGRNLTDGALSAKAVKVVQIEAAATRKHVDELHHAGLWDRTGDGFLIHDYLDRNLSRTEVETIRAKRQEAGRKGGINSGRSRRNEANGEANAQAVASKQNGKHQGSTPSRPPSKSKPSGEENEIRSEIERQLRAVEDVPW